MKTTIFKSFTIALMFFGLLSCSSSGPKYTKTAVDKLITKLSSTPNYSIILADMDYSEAKNSYQHQYQIIKNVGEEISNETTEWFNVSDIFFDKHKEDLGMEIVSKKDGVLSKKVAPAGYSNYIGNEKYGRWNNSGGSSFWEFYGKYAMLSSMFRMTMYPVSYGMYGGYRSYRGNSYYGSAGQTYGTRGNYTSKTTRWDSKPSTFKSRVRSRVTQSAKASKTRASNRRSRSSSRYSRSSTRSRSGGFGK